jgi:GNAT superfamily N-acetyltransferase
LRLEALRDEVAHLAFLETYEQAAARPDSFWRERTDRAAQGRGARQLVAERADGRWLGTLTVLVERPGTEVFGGTAPMPQAHVVGVYVRPEARGTGLSRELLQAGAEWAWAVPEPHIDRVRLWVHEDNARAEALYTKGGFVRTGATTPMPGGDRGLEHELALPRP